ERAKRSVAAAQRLDGDAPMWPPAKRRCVNGIAHQGAGVGVLPTVPRHLPVAMVRKRAIPFDAVRQELTNPNRCRNQLARRDGVRDEMELLLTF
ncbi:MAG: hypothetical protein WAU78_03720, partial [Roseiarcus sp.]